MSDDFLKNPLSLFDIRGKTAIVTGASGAFGALASKVLAGAGCNLVLTAGGLEALKKVAAECGELGAKVEAINIRPTTAENCEKVVAAAVKRFGGVDILVLAAGINKVSKIVDQPPEAFAEVMDVNVTQSWLMARAAGKQMLAQGRGGKETVVRAGDSCYIGPNESREIVNRGNEVCTIAVAVAPVK